MGFIITFESKKRIDSKWRSLLIGKLWKPTVMFFGLQNSPATFQSMMNALFDDLIKEGWVIIYMDDILIFSEDLEEHRILVKKVLQRLQDEDLF